MPCKGDKKISLLFGKSVSCPWRAGEKIFSQIPVFSVEGIRKFHEIFSPERNKPAAKVWLFCNILGRLSSVLYTFSVFLYPVFFIGLVVVLFQSDREKRILAASISGRSIFLYLFTSLPSTIRHTGTASLNLL